MKKLYKVTLNAQIIKTSENLDEVLALALNVYKATNEPLYIEILEDELIIVTFVRRADNE